MTKKTEDKKVEKKETIVETKTKTLDKKELRFQARELGIDSDTVLDFLEDDDLEGLATLIETEKEKIEEQGKVIELVKGSSLNKQEKNCLGLWYTGNMDSWNLFTSASTKWLQPVASIVMTPEFQEFMASNKRLADVKKFVEFLEKK